MSEKHKVWVCLESLKPLRWAVREGNRWYTVKEIDIRLPMKTKRGKRAPHGYLSGTGTVTISGDRATIR